MRSFYCFKVQPERRKSFCFWFIPLFSREESLRVLLDAAVAIAAADSAVSVIASAAASLPPLPPPLAAPPPPLLTLPPPKTGGGCVAPSSSSAALLLSAGAVSPSPAVVSFSSCRCCCCDNELAPDAGKKISITLSYIHHHSGPLSIMLLRLFLAAAGRWWATLIVGPLCLQHTCDLLIDMPGGRCILWQTHLRKSR